MNVLRISRFNNRFLFFLILFSADGISFLNQNVYPISTVILILFTFYAMLKNRVSFRGFIKLLIPWILYCLISFIYFDAVRPLFFIILPASFFAIYVLINSNITLKIIFSSFEKIIFKLATISLLFYTWQLVNLSSLISLFNLFDLNVGKSYNLIVYTIHHRSIDGFLAQNPGFCWEPGPFACFLVLSLVIHLLQSKFRLDKRTFIYIITILTTFSTTGYLCLFLLIVWYFFNKNKKYFYLILPIISAIIVTFYFQSFNLDQKIYDQITSAESDLEFYIDNEIETQTSIGRFNGFLLNLKDFEKYPILGYGGNFISKFASENNLKITSTNGLGNWLAQYGIVGFVFLIFYFYKSSFLITSLYKSSGFLFLFFIFLLMSFSFSLMSRPLFILFFFSFFIISNKRTKLY